MSLGICIFTELPGGLAGGGGHWAAMRSYHHGVTGPPGQEADEQNRSRLRPGCTTTGIPTVITRQPLISPEGKWGTTFLLFLEEKQGPFVPSKSPLSASLLGLPYQGLEGLNKEVCHLTILEARSLRPRCRPAVFSGGLSPGLVHGHLLPVSSHSPSLCVTMSYAPLVRTRHVGLGPTQMTTFNSITFKDAVSKHSHI